MEIVVLALLLLISFGVKAQTKSITTTNADGSQSTSLSVALGKPSTTTTSHSNFSYPNGINPEPIVSKKGANKKTYILVTNESDANLAKFAISIFSGNKSLSKGTLLIRLSATSFISKLLGNGRYNFSENSPEDRLKYEFSGTVKLGSIDITISEGWFTVVRDRKQIEINYDLTLTNGVKTTGQYSSEYQMDERSSQLVLN
jgi:hypothetical protein